MTKITKYTTVLFIFLITFTQLVWAEGLSRNIQLKFVDNALTVNEQIQLLGRAHASPSLILPVYGHQKSLLMQFQITDVKAAINGVPVDTTIQNSIGAKNIVIQPKEGLQEGAVLRVSYRLENFYDSNAYFAFVDWQVSPIQGFATQNINVKFMRPHWVKQDSFKAKVVSLAKSTVTGNADGLTISLQDAQYAMLKFGFTKGPLPESSWAQTVSFSMDNLSLTSTSGWIGLLIFVTLFIFFKVFKLVIKRILRAPRFNTLEEKPRISPGIASMLLNGKIRERDYANLFLGTLINMGYKGQLRILSMESLLTFFHVKPAEDHILEEKVIEMHLFGDKPSYLMNDATTIRFKNMVNHFVESLEEQFDFYLNKPLNLVLNLIVTLSGLLIVLGLAHFKLTSFISIVVLSLIFIVSLRYARALISGIQAQFQKEHKGKRAVYFYYIPISLLLFATMLLLAAFSLLLLLTTNSLLSLVVLLAVYFIHYHSSNYFYIYNEHGRFALAFLLGFRRYLNEQAELSEKEIGYALALNIPIEQDMNCPEWFDTGYQGSSTHFIARIKNLQNKFNRYFLKKEILNLKNQDASIAMGKPYQGNVKF